MLYLGIDLHRKQMTVALRDQSGSVCLRRQVSTRPQKVEEFVLELGARSDGPYIAILEVCGFHDWLVKRLRADPACHKVLVVQPETTSRNKTDRRDANTLSERLWVNRERLGAGQKVQGLRVVYIPTDDEQQDRQLTASRDRLGRARTRTINQIRHILRRHNLVWELPTKTFQTLAVKKWLKQLATDSIKSPLSELDRREIEQLLEQWELWNRHIMAMNQRLAARYEENAAAKLLGTIIGVSYYMALAITSRVGNIARFANPRSLANFFGLVPGSRSSGETERLGSITKQGSRLVRFLLGQLTVHVLRRDSRMRTWYKRIKQRRGSKIARVAVMRRLAVIIWHMLSKQQAYKYGGEPSRPRQEAARAAAQSQREKKLAEFEAGTSRRASRGAKGSAGANADGPKCRAGSSRSARPSTGSSTLCQT
jgi:transposase